MNKGLTDDIPGYGINLLYAAHINLVVDIQTFDVPPVSLRVQMCWASDAAMGVGNASSLLQGYSPDGTIGSERGVT